MGWKTNMGENTKIEYARTWNPWLSCVGKRRRTSDANWKKPLTWNRKAACVCVRQPPHRWVCPQHPAKRPHVFLSLCDPFEDWQGLIVDAAGYTLLKCDHCGLYHPDTRAAGHESCKCSRFKPRMEWATMSDLRRDMFVTIRETPNLDWLLLTKRIENARGMILDYCEWLEEPSSYFSNVWLLYSASDQESLEAGIDHLVGCRDLVNVLGLSLEPLVGPIRLPAGLELLDWVIVGGESGPKRRPMNLDWLWDIQHQCKAAGIKLFVKQDNGPKPGIQGRIPDELWSVKQFPEVNHV